MYELKKKGERHQLVELTAILKHETGKAWLFDMEFGSFWVPKSIGEYHPDDCVLVIPQGFAKEKGMI
jgi:hypothetical protein